MSLPSIVAVCADVHRSAQRSQGAPVYGYEVVNVYPHDREAFTQGLLYRDGVLFESTGLNGRSSLRKVELETGKVLQQISVDRRYFAEGLTDWGVAPRAAHVEHQRRLCLRSGVLQAAADLQLHRRGLGPGARRAAA